eukprot:14990180-Alexandrium_andersonii.AAC.1
MCIRDRGQPHWGSVRPVRKDGFDLPLVKGTQKQGMELPCDPKGHHSMPPACQPARAATLVASAGPQGQSPQTPHGRGQWAAHRRPDHWPQS